MKRQQIDELHQMTISQLQAKIGDLQQQLAQAQLEKRVGKLDNPRFVSTLRDDIARAKTIKRHKELVAIAQEATGATQKA